MKTYAFKIRKKDLTISLEAETSKLIAKEFEKFAKYFVANKDDVTIETNFEITETVPKKSTKKSKPAEVSTAQTIAQKTIAVENISNDIEKVPAQPKKIAALPANFAKILAEKSTQTSNVVEKKVSERKNAYLQMQNAIREKSLQTEVDYIVAAAYCLVHYENMLRFTEEQLKAKIAPFFEEELDHNFVLDAVAKNLIKVLPDFTGFSDTIEFELTEQGEEYFLNEL